MEQTVRPYISKDFDPVCLLELGTKGSPYAAAVFVRQAAELYPETFLVLMEEGMVRGYAVGGIVPARPGEAWIMRMRIADTCQGRGLGRMLTSALISILQNKGVHRIFLTVSPANIPATRLYSSAGFFETAFKPDYFGPGEDRLIMSRTF
jgi:ribosomal protein S18 acetylase RimI-like enzyme